MGTPAPGRRARRRRRRAGARPGDRPDVLPALPRRRAARPARGTPATASPSDEDGYLHFEGRTDDVIISAGYRIGPFEVESALVAHEAVAEAAVVAAPDDERGSIVRAVVVLRDGYAPSDDAGRASCRTTSRPRPRRTSTRGSWTSRRTCPRPARARSAAQCSGRRRRQREGQRLAVRARAQRVVGVDQLAEAERHRVVGDRRRCTSAGSAARPSSRRCCRPCRCWRRCGPAPAAAAAGRTCR